MTTPATHNIRAARDLLLSLRGSYEKAIEVFEWPDVGERFNWAHDWFDALAVGNAQAALVIVEEDGSRAEYSFDDIATTSDQIAASLSQHGLSRGDSVLVMLGNQVELWQTMLAVIKVGAVIMPTTSAVGPAELLDRMERGDAKFVVCNPADADKFSEVPGDYQRIAAGAVGGDGWLNLHDAYALGDVSVEHPGTLATDRMLLYFTSGTTSRPKLVEHSQISYPVGHLSTMYWIGLQPGDVHLNISSPGWAKHAWSCFFAPWLAEATIFIYNYVRFDAAALLKQLRIDRVTSLCAPPTVWRMLINADLSGGSGSLRELVGAGEPLNPAVIEQVRKRWGLTIRDGFGQTEMTAAVGNTPGAEVRPGSMGRRLPGVPVVLIDPITGNPTEAGEGEICTSPSLPVSSRPRRRHLRSSSTRASTWRRISGFAGSSSSSCLRRSPARFAGSSFGRGSESPPIAGSRSTSGATTSSPN